MIYLNIKPLTENGLSQLKDLTPLNWSGNVHDTFKFHFGKTYFHPIVAEKGEQIVGCAYGLLHENSGWLSNIIVLPEFRGQGFGTKLTSNLIDRLRSEVCITLNLCATKAGISLYKNLGFATSATYTLLKRERSLLERLLTKTLRQYGEHFYKILPAFLKKYVLWEPTPHIRKIEPEDYGRVMNIDKYITGENRKAFLNQYLSSGWVYQGNIQEEITGFYLEGFGNAPIYALDPKSGLELLQFKIGRGSKNICVPTANKVAIKFLVNSGFRITEIQPRMTLGPSIDWKPQGVFNRGGGTG